MWEEERAKERERVRGKEKERERKRKRERERKRENGSRVGVKLYCKAVIHPHDFTHMCGMTNSYV